MRGAKTLEKSNLYLLYNNIISNKPKNYPIKVLALLVNPKQF